LAEHDRIGSPLRSELGPGEPPERVEETLRAIGLTAPGELVELFGWRQVRPELLGAPRVAWFWPAQPRHFDEAVDHYRQSIEIGGITPAALEKAIRAGQPPEATFTGFWRTDWFPWLFGSPEEYAIECRDGASEAPVWRVNWHPDQGFQTKQVGTSVTDFIERVVELFRAGAYTWDPADHSIVPVDEVFTQRGLDENRPPWDRHYRPASLRSTN
ncbi:MAG TPA: hypothetical protein VHM48_01330, partial [Candidatus Limnocylindrales bacterium]|nr:hypothetical protein [Candidatus Limnocylindrales bacterium]